jgi:phosphatidylglycerol:prolipoprotein diacylglycerol transferase
MFPLPIDIGSTQFHLSPLIFMTLGLVIGVIMGSREYQRLGFNNQSRNQMFWALAIPLVFLISMFSAFLLNIGGWDLFENLENALSFGFSSFGAILGALFLGYVQSKLFNEPTAGKRLDFISSILPLSLGIYRIGCLLNGCCYGEVTDGPFGIYLPDAYGVWAYRFPTQIYLMLFDFGLFFWLWQRRDKQSFEGKLTLSFLITFGIGRFLIDGLRDLPAALGSVSPHQLVSFCIFAIALYIAYEFRNEKSGRTKMTKA